MIVVLDNLLPNFNEYKSKVLNSTFQDVLSQGIKYSDITQEVPGSIIYDKLHENITFKSKDKLNFLRAYRNREYKHPMWIHSDVLFSDYIAIFMIQSSEAPQDDGVALWKNKQLDDIQLYTKDHTGEKNIIVDSQTLDPDKWEMWKRIEFKENRLVMFPASYFHSKASYSNRGSDLNDSRIVHILFFDEDKENE